jgi:predicted O-linked N-acetylglucosamine transferase (SPINDLY family)
MDLNALLRRALDSHQRGELTAAAADYQQILALKPGHPRVTYLLGAARGQQGACEDALALLEDARAAMPGDPAEALADFDRAIALQPDYPEACSNRGTALRELRRFEDGLASYEKSIALRPDYPEFAMNRAIMLVDLKRHEDALAGFDSVLAMNADYPRAWGEAAAAALYACNWPRRKAFAAQMRAKVEAGAFLKPLALHGYLDDPALHRVRAEFAAGEILARGVAPLWQGERYSHDRIRLVYVSSDFRDHPVGQQLIEVIERHDRGTFEVIGVSVGADDGSPLRRRFAAAFDRFHELKGASHADIAQQLHRLEADIAIDLNGYTEGGSLGAFLRRPAPLQVEWLGYAGTIGGGIMDAVIADNIAAPDPAHFSETLIHLPHSFFPMDTTRAIAATPSRADQGLPETGFIFCCLNNNWKIAPEVFDIWMRLLLQVPGSVLWLRGGNAAQLRAEAQKRGVAPERLVFSGFAAADVHLARHRLADLFLDTLPYNAHATTADALWAGLPVLTRAGKSFPSRIAASLVTAAGLPELVTESAQDYEALALALARDPARLKTLHDRLAKREAPLFDMARFTRDLEAALLHALHKKTGE